MFCPHCGSETAAELKYCKRCGGPNPLALAQAQEGRPVISPGMVWAAGCSTAFVVVAGLGVVAASVVEMSRAGVGPVAVIWIALFLALTLFGSVALMLRFWSYLLGAVRPPAAAQLPPASRPADTSDLGPQQQQGALPEPRFASVTEHTTRTFENLKNKQQ